MPPLSSLRSTGKAPQVTSWTPRPQLSGKYILSLNQMAGRPTPLQGLRSTSGRARGPLRCSRRAHTRTMKEYVIVCPTRSSSTKAAPATSETTINSTLQESEKDTLCVFNERGYSNNSVLSYLRAFFRESFKKTVDVVTFWLIKTKMFSQSMFHWT